MKRYYKKILFAVAILAGLLLINLAPIHAADTSIILPKCDPALPLGSAPGPNGPPCDANQFITLIKNIIRWLTIIAFPLAAIFIGWGGFDIMTAAGNSEKVSGGWKRIKVALMGVVVLLFSYIIIQLVFNALKIPSDLRPGGTTINDPLFN